MFRRDKEEELATQPQGQNQNQPHAQAQQPVSPFGASAQPAGPKPATPSFGSFGAPAENNSDIRKPVTAPLTTQQVGLGSAGVASSAPTQGANFNKATAPAAGSLSQPAGVYPQTYNKVPAPTSAPAPIPAAATSMAPQSKLDGIEAERRLTVGYGITLTGEVSDCDRLVIYGKVNAKLANVKFLQISDSGKFNGSATIDQAEISGVFEGELKVANNITITSTGRVNGKITYGSIEIRPGGKFTGEIVEDTTALASGATDNQQSGQSQPQSSASDTSKDYYGLYNNQGGTTSDKAA